MSGAGQAVVPGGDRELGRGLCEAEPARRLHTGGQVHRLDSTADERTGVTEDHVERKKETELTHIDEGFRPQFVFIFCHFFCPRQRDQQEERPCLTPTSFPLKTY